jgi:hypothetical protein
LPSPIVIHVRRPYASEQEYLDHESFSIDARSMLLIDQAPLEVDTLVVFDVSLASGHKPIRAEGKVVAYVAADGNTPAGMRVRFKRFGAATKAFIDRAVSCTPPRSVEGEALPLTLSYAPEGPQSTASGAQEVPVPSLIPQRPSLAVPAVSSEVEESSGVHARTVLPVAPPLNREALLDRLRARSAG